MIEFPVSGAETYWWLPFVVAFGVSSLSSVAGLSGAFLLLPFQMSVLGFVGPGASATNLLYNIVSIPSGVIRYYREGRLVKPLAWAIIIGTLPGTFMGAVVRIRYLPDPANFKPFVGLVLLYIAFRMVMTIVRRSKSDARNIPSGVTTDNQRFGLRDISYSFMGEDYRASTPGLMAICFVVGLVGGTYGIGGGAIVAPFLVSLYRLPVYTIAGATLLSTFVTSVAGVAFYWLYDIVVGPSGVSAAPDLLLGGMLGAGGAVGMYVGARLQRYLPSRLIKVILTLLLLFAAGRYLIPLVL